MTESKDLVIDATNKHPSALVEVLDSHSSGHRTSQSRLNNGSAQIKIVGTTLGKTGLQEDQQQDDFKHCSKINDSGEKVKNIKLKKEIKKGTVGPDGKRCLQGGSYKSSDHAAAFLAE